MSVIDIGDYNKRRCKEGMMDSYMSYAYYQESPPDFHLWVLIGMIASALGRNTFVSMGMWETYPNMYIVLVGESAITHKSTSIKMGWRAFREALPDVPALGQKMSPQALIHSLSLLGEDDAVGRAEATIEASELSNLLGQAKMDDTFIKVLTDLWDSPDYFTYHTVGRGIEKLKDVCLNMIGGSTPAWLRNSVPEEALEGGFFSRLILVHRPPKGEKNPCPIVSAEQREHLENVKHDLACIRNNMSGEFIVEEGAQQLFSEWYCTMNHPEKAESFMRGYYGRKGDFLQKVAMCLSASYSDDMLITYDDMALALRLLNENEVHCAKMVKYMGTTQEGNKHVQVMNLIRRGTVNCPPDDTTGLTKEQIRNEMYTPVVKVGIRHSDLIRKLSYKMKKDDVIASLGSLADSGDIKTVLLPPRNAKAYVWCGAEEVD